MTRDRTKPQFLRDIEHDGTIIKRLDEIRQEENRAASAIVTQPEMSYGCYNCDPHGIEWYQRSKRLQLLREKLSAECGKARQNSNR